MMYIKLSKVFIAFAIIFLSVVNISSVMAGGGDDNCECNLVINEENKLKHIYVCRSSCDYIEEDCSGGAKQLSGFLEDLAEYFEHHPSDESIRCKISAMHSKIKEKVEHGDSEFSKSRLTQTIIDMQTSAMGNQTSLDIIQCAFTKQELSEIMHYLYCVVNCFCGEYDKNASHPWLVNKDGRLLVAFSSALIRWHNVYGEKTPVTKDERKIFHSIVIYLLLSQYMDICERFMGDGDSKHLDTHHAYFKLTMKALQTKYSQLLDGVYSLPEYVENLLNPIHIDDYINCGNLVGLGRIIEDKAGEFCFPSIGWSESKKMYFDFVVMKHKDGGDEIKTIVMGGLYEFNSPKDSIGKDMDALLNTLKSRPSLRSDIKTAFRYGWEAIASQFRHFGDLFRTLVDPDTYY
ncbi:MAG: hypothetical protein QS748_07375 [Candidatus Endonucleobacter bathymodioli]|uniref:Uncharacterized protein n=1 Tax=Candidatus Endonucleibacter bathymodioli TaxID=539814 RepID=A0AA90NR62_9GAMM|nr:hypothetical protein [Candidatus Endonucleobacter bathymodioli]